MRHNLYMKALVIGVLILFVGASVIPSIGGNIGNNTNAKDVDGEKAGVSEKTQANPNGGIQPLGWETRNTELVSAQSNKSALCVDIAVDAYGVVHAAWVDWSNYGSHNDNQYDIFYKYRTASGVWSNPEVVSTESTGQANSSVSLALQYYGSQVLVHVAWVDYSNISYNGVYCGNEGNIFYKCKQSGLWPTVTEVVSTESDKPVAHPSLAVDSNNAIVHIAWVDYSDVSNNGNDGDIFYKCKPSGGSWPTVTEIVSTNSPNISGAPSLDLGGNGTEVHIAWHEKTDPTYYDIFYKNKINGIWGPTELVSTESKRFAEYPSLAVDHNDNAVHVAWMDTTKYTDPATNKPSGGEWDIFYKCRDPVSGVWSPTEVVSLEGNGDSRYPSIDTDSFSRVHVAWDDDSAGFSNIGSPFIFYKSKPRTCNGWWMYPDVVSSESNRRSGGPCLKIGADNSIHIAWHDFTDISNHVDNYWDIFYKLGDGEPYFWNTGSLKFIGHGFLDNVNGVYDFDLKVKKPIGFNNYYIMGVRFLPLVIFFHGHFRFLYTHGTYDQALNNPVINGCNITYTGYVSALGLQGRSYP